MTGGAGFGCLMPRTSRHGWRCARGVTSWFCEEMLGRPSLGVTALRDWFARWRAITDPPIPMDLALAGRGAAADELRGQLLGPACELSVVSQSNEESLAIIASALLSAARGADDTTDVEITARCEAVLERCLVVDDAI